MKVTPEYNLAVLYPELMKEWHPIKNHELDPYTLAPKSSKFAWWICAKNHEWRAKIADRAKGTGCKICLKIKYRTPKEGNSLAEKYPEIAKQWNSNKNGNLTPRDVTPNSHERIWWICEKCGYEWQTRVQDRLKVHGCKVCSGRIASNEKNLEAEYPEIAKEWHPTKNNGLKPIDVLPKSQKIVYWVCKKGHVWKTSISSRTAGGTDCPHCKARTSKIEIRIYCELKGIFKEVEWRKKINGLECDALIPKYNVGIEIDGFPWHEDTLDHDFKKSIKLKDSGLNIIRLRDDRLPKLFESDILYKNGEDELLIVKRLLENLKNTLKLEKEDFETCNDYIQTNKYVNESEYNKITSILSAPVYEQSLAYIHPDIASEWNYSKNEPLTPDLFSPGSHQRVWWVCNKCGYEWRANIDQRVSRGVKKGTGCKMCSSKKRTEDARKRYVRNGGSLLEMYPLIAQEWNYAKNGSRGPADVAPQSNLRVSWICKRNPDHEWTEKIQKRILYNRGCPYCAGKKHVSHFKQGTLEELSNK